MVSVSQPALAPQCSVSVNLFPFVATPAYVCDAGAHRMSINWHASGATNAFSLFVNSFVCIRFILYVYVTSVCLSWMFLCGCDKASPCHCKSGTRHRATYISSQNIICRSHTSIFVIFICLVYLCLYYSSHILWYTFVILKLRKIIYAFTQNV